MGPEVTLRTGTGQLLCQVSRRSSRPHPSLLCVRDAEDVGVTSAPGTLGSHLGTWSFQVFTEGRLKDPCPVGLAIFF